MATPQQDQCPAQDRTLELLQQIEGLTAQLRTKLIKAKEEKKTECTSQGGDNGEVFWTLRKANADLTKQIKDSDAFHDRVVEMLNDTHEEEIEALEAAHKKELEVAKSKAETNQKDIQRRNVEMNALKKKAATVGELQRKIGGLEKQLSTLGAVEKELTEAKKDLVAEKKQRVFLQKQIDNFQGRIKQLDNWDRLQEDLARALNARDDYKKRCEELEKRKR
ncbi:uncharacterized protein K444DRAFT_698853 [Hyaloscypha bicolor E]|uniref:Uncharacterized protein n=1 Tax=Hyaloscypha bicolor E TaxID=1095630 RepID=A0A2J6TUS4_9HELO|nr:uncharacterized protein K444DRAFT_698853 [Hyaloscypha bicolor E]PMD66755.1 hypothetical protein K444DRAFT_698853 [Hyaloscypha bicolor E]